MSLGLPPEIVAKLLEGFRKSYEEDGYKGALIRAIRFCFNEEIVAPEWIVDAFYKATNKWYGFEVKEFGAAFDMMRPKGTNLNALKKKRRLAWKVYGLVEDEAVTLGQAVGEAVDAMDKPTTAIRTGFDDLDRMLPFGGMTPGDLLVPAGRPSQGKTSLAMCIAEHVAATNSVAVFTLESSRRALAARSLKYHEGLLTNRTDAVTHLFNLKMWIDDTPAVSLAYIRLRLRRIKRKAGLGLVVIDYLQLIRAKAENRTQEISEVSRGLKEIAKEFDVPVLAVAQLSRAPENRTDHRPMLSDLRESGQLEQDADVILFIYRDEEYNPGSHLAGIAEILVRKNRDGPTGSVYLQFDKAHTRFHNHVGACKQGSKSAYF